MTTMNTRPIPLLLVAALAVTASTLPAMGQDDRKPAPPAPPESAQRPQEPGRPPGPPERRGGPRDEHRDGRMEPRRDGQRGPEDEQRPEDGPRRDGERGPGGGPGREHFGNIPMPPPAPPVPTPYIGVLTMPPPEVLSAQLSLKEGFGLVVGDVLPESPAAKAGLKKYDVLTKFNDQQLVDAGQFSTLVRAAGKDTEATLTLLREAKEQKVPVKIGERMVPQRMPMHPGGMDPRGQMEKWRGPAQEGMKRMQERMNGFGEKMRDYQERLKGWQKNPTGDVPQLPATPDFQSETAGLGIDPVDILVQAQPGGTRQIRLFQPDSAVSYYTADTKMLMKDDNGEIEVSSKDGKRILVARDAKGAVLFDGPIDTEEQRKALPEEVRKKLESIQVRATATASVAEAPAFLPGTDDNVQ